MSLEFILLGAQAAGSIVDIFGTQQSLRHSKRAFELEEGQVNLRMKQDLIASQEQSLFALQNLTETLASQRAISAARGALPGVGSALAIEQKSIRAFKQDERARQLSLNFAGEQKKAQLAMGRIGLAGERAQAATGLFGRMFQNLPLSQMANKSGLLTGSS